MGRQHAVAGHDVGLRVGVVADLADPLEGAEAAGEGDSLVPVRRDLLRGKKTLPVLLRQLGIDRVPWCLKHASQKVLMRCLGE